MPHLKNLFVSLKFNKNKNKEIHKSWIYIFIKKILVFDLEN